MDEKENGIDLFGPQVVLAFVAALMGDITFFFIITHYLCGAIMIGAAGSKTKGIAAKVALGLAFILPGPTLVIGLIIALILSNKILAFLAEQAAIQTVAVFTGGAGEALEGVAVAAEGAEAVGTIVEAGEAAVEAGEAIGVAGEAAGAAAEGAQAAGEAAEAGTEAAEESGKGFGDKVADKIEEKGREKLKETLDGSHREDETPREREAREKRENQEQYDEDINSGGAAPIMDETEEQLLGNRTATPQERKPTKAPEPPRTKAAPEENASTRRLRERFEKAQKVREELEKIKQPIPATKTPNEDQDSNYIEEAA